MPFRLLVAAAIAWILAAATYTTLRVTFGDRPVYIHVRWAPSVDEPARERLEQRFGLAQGEWKEGRTWGYSLTSLSRANIQALVQDPAVEDTTNIHRTRFRVGIFAPRRPYLTTDGSTRIPVGLEVLSAALVLGGLVAFGAAIFRMIAPTASLGGAAMFRWATPLVALIAAFFVALLAAGSPWYGWFLDEDGVVEDATALVLGLAGVFFAIAWRRTQRKPIRYFIGLLSLLLFAAAMDEISWGQRLFGISSPEFFLENSDQSEINLHNVLQQELAIRTKHVVGLGFLAYGVMLPWLLKTGRVSLGRVGRYVVFPPSFLRPAILIGVLFMADVPTGDEEEIGELLLGLCLCAFGGYEAFSRSPSIDAAAILRRHERRLLDVVRHLPAEPRAKVQGELARTLVSEPFHVETPRGPLRFAVLGETSGFRAKGLLTKQQATIAWIDAFSPDSVFWDIGANIGSYALYAALRRDLRVVAFEPAAVNYFLLSANCELNAFGEHLDCLQVGVGDGKRVGHLDVSQFEPAMSFSFRAKGKRPLASRQAVLILSIDQLVEEYGVPCPNYIKIDVPAMSGAIIEGGAQTLQRVDVREIHIEASETSVGGRRIVEALGGYGFVIAARHVHGDTTDLTFART
jgi:FkbM family methyltransferase